MTMKPKIIRYKKGAFLLLCLCTATLILHNELTHQYNMKYSMFRQGRTLLLSSESKEIILKGLMDGQTDNQHVGGIERRSLVREKDSANNGGNFSRLTNGTFEHWKQSNPKALSIFVFTAVASNNTINGFKHVIKLNSWEAAKSRKSLIKCCFVWSNNKTTFYTSPNKTYTQKLGSGLSAAQIHCPIKGNVHDVTGVALAYKKEKCPIKKERYVKPMLPLKKKEGSFAICGKIFYGNVDVKMVIDWVEYYRQMKADKIIIYTYNLTKKAQTVIQHYAKTGYVETGKFDFPWKTGQREVGTKNLAAWMDEQVVVFDCFERLRGYTYFTIVDLDEFILPRSHKDLKGLAWYLWKHFPKAAGFSFKSHLYIKDWGKTVVNKGSDIVQYFNRTSAVYTREKNLIMPNRIVDGTIHTHRFEPKQGYEKIIVNPEVATINHYRNCYHNFYYRCTHTKRYTDRTILKVVNKIKRRTSVLVKKFA